MLVSASQPLFDCWSELSDLKADNKKERRSNSPRHNHNSG